MNGKNSKTKRELPKKENIKKKQINEVLMDKIFIAISEELVAEMLKQAAKNNRAIPIHKYKENGLEKHDRIFEQVKTEVAKDFKIKIDKNTYNTDDQHKIDILLKHNDGAYAIEVKAGNKGAGESRNQFEKYCKQKKCRFQKKSNKTEGRIAGRMAAILAHLKNNEINEYKIVISDGSTKIDLEREWFLCLRKSNKKWNTEGKYKPSEIFEFCSIIFINELAEIITKKEFIKIILRLVPFGNNQVFQDEMWKRAISENQRAEEIKKVK